MSPWSSKATDILQHCGLPQVKRVERGVQYFINASKPMTVEELELLGDSFHDRMTETVVSRSDEAARLFHHTEPAPMQTVAVLEQGRGALEVANGELGSGLISR